MAGLRDFFIQGGVQSDELFRNRHSRYTGGSVNAPYTDYATFDHVVQNLFDDTSGPLPYTNSHQTNDS